ncbi:N-6 DNA methylase [Marinobacter daepoensis]|uniref:N-6 DNA methylase n=1 Tax=Marinobacter daepoensis TaxID=262077 RepID=UPI001C95B485|nr:N-6 DNA methylase [Marinobacter daepoensis]MBY6032363.1 N-6 DNA methylase [Marinobacter daepoensis]
MAKKRAESRARYYLREQAKKRGWRIGHPSKGGEILEEQEIVDFFPDIGLGLERPDFLIVKSGLPVVVIEAKNEASKIDQAIAEAIEYAETINSHSPYEVKFAVGAAGEENHGFTVEVRYKKGSDWKPLLSRGYEITTIPSRREVDVAIAANDGTTEVDVPDVSQFIDAAIELSRILRTARVEAPLRPKVIGALALAMYQGAIDIREENALDSINELIHEAIEESVDLSSEKKPRLEESLRLLGADYERLSPFIGKIVRLLQGLNIRAVLQTDTDFLGLFYEAFLRYGYDNNALGIVFTPRHITRFCAELVDVRTTDKVIDLACGTGGFLVAAFDKMMSSAHGPKAIQKVKKDLYGFDTNPTIWALATLNMFFRGDGKSHIENKSCLDEESKALVYESFHKAFLNPPFSQDDEPERDFIDASMEALEPEGLIAVVVKAGIFADDENKPWRREFTRNHSILAMVSLPDDLFYPTAAPTSILVAKAHIPQSEDGEIFISRIKNDGFEKLKGRRVEIDGSELPETLEDFRNFRLGRSIGAKNCTVVSARKLLNGNEWSPQQWLPQPIESEDKLKTYEENVRFSIYRALASMPELSESVLEDFCAEWETLPDYPLSETASVSSFFHVCNGRSSGEKNYFEGSIPYISSGDLSNSIIRLVAPEEQEAFLTGGITVTAFGQAYVQPWPFMARGNGGSSVRVLIPRYKMNFNDLVWFASQINAQRWRFFYARMAIKSRLERLEITSPRERLKDSRHPISERVKEFKDILITLSEAS